MDFLNMFEMAGIEMPAVNEVKEVPKKEKASKKEKTPTTKPIKSMVKLPVTAYVQGYGIVNVGSDVFEGKAEAGDAEVKDYLNKTLSLPDGITFTFDKSNVYVGFSESGAKTGEITIPEDAIAWFGSFSCSLSEIAGKITVKELADFLVNAGLPLGDVEKVKVILADNGKVIVPVPAKVEEKELKKLSLPLTVNMYGSWEDIVISADAPAVSEPSGDEEEIESGDVAAEDEGDESGEISEEEDSKESVEPMDISTKSITAVIVAKYPEFKDRVVLCALGSEGGRVSCYFSMVASGVSTKKKEETFKVAANTTFRFYAVNVDVKLEEGEYTLKSICKALAKAGIPECNAPETIMAKQVGDSICLAVKFGGSKGAVANISAFPFSDFAPYSVEEGTTDDGGYYNIRPCWKYAKAADEQQFFVLRTPLIPKIIFEQVVSLFAKFASINKECLARIYWNPESEEYVLRVPDQTVATASVVPEDEGDDEFLFTHLPVLEVHSHGKAYDAFFSMTDDASECSRHALYGVFSFNEDGSIRNTKFRCCSGAGREMTLPISGIFDINDLSYSYDNRFVSDTIRSTHFTIR